MYVTLWSRQRAHRPIVTSPQFGQRNWVAPGPGTARPHDVHRSSDRACIDLERRRGYFRTAPRRRAATRVIHIKSTPTNATTPRTYHTV